MLNNATGFKKIYIACGQTDLRRGIEGLANIIRFQFQLDPYDKDTLFLFCGKRIPESKAFYGKVTAFCFSTRDLMSEHSAGLVIQQRPLRLPQNNTNFSWKASPLLQSALSQSLLTRLEPFSFVQYVENKILHYGAYLIVTGTYPRTEYR